MTELTIRNLSKKYKKTAAPALSDFSYDFSYGVYGLLGPNGAGKSTLMNLIVGNLAPTTGEICYEDRNITALGSDYRSILGYMPQQQQLYDSFSVKRFLFYFAALKGLSQAEAKEKIGELLELVGLYGQANERLRALSGGMKQRVLLAQALLNDPKILILDEPTAGLDPKERLKIRNYIYSIAEKKTIILATHVISDVEQIAKELIFLREGETVLAGPPDKVIEAVSGAIWETEIPREEYPELNRSFLRNRVVGERNDLVHVKIISDTKPESGNVREAAVNLEDVYLYLYP
ncbi:MAG: ATP-binding cassette domain-containing protein [Lachnospiraceae bacterium]|nr:ATP-binding cassette domain-containing protein [Lachnospiraceae bacterium]